MATVQELIDDVLIDIRAADPGETPSSADRDFGLRQLNRLVVTWPHKLTRSTISTTGATSYNLASRPLKIKSANTIAGNVSQPIKVVAAEEFSALSVDRSRVQKYIDCLLYDNGYTTGVIYVYPAAASGGTIELFSILPVTAFSGLSDSIDMAPGYERAMRSALALELANSYGLPVTPQLEKAAAEAQQFLTQLTADVLTPNAPPAQN